MGNLFNLSEEQVRVGLGAMRAVAAANGQYDEHERALMDAASKALDGPADAPEASPDAVRAAFPDELWRKRILQAMIGMALIDGEATKDELACIDTYARALEVDEPWLKNLHRLVDGHMTRLRIDFARRMPLAGNLFKEVWQDEGLKGMWKLYRVFTLKGTNEPELAWKYKRLGLLPEGTLGREFWKHMTERGFAFPGEPGGFLERQCHHDLTHVLTGYDTDPDGECQIASFYAGYDKQEPFAFLFMVLVMFQVGAKLGPAAVTPARFKFDPAKVIRAMERGSHINTDLKDHWDYWPVMDKPIADVRRLYNIV